MKILQSLPELSSSGASPAIGLTIGNFDGVHLGHRQLLAKIKSDCVAKKLLFTVVTFVPHPHKILHPEKESFLINSYEKRRSLLEQQGVDILVEMKFTRDFSTLSPEEFLERYLLVYPGISHLYLGYDFAFGANKQGGFDLVKNLCGPKGIEVELQPVFETQKQVVSSTVIRELILQGDVEKAGIYLGRSFDLEGVVVKGEGRGKKIGYPTANVQAPSDLILPGNGVYITKTTHQGMVYHSVTNIGHNPTFKQSKQLHIETNLFDFDSDIYGENLSIQFVKKIRDERRFPSVNELISQISDDVAVAREYFKNL